MPTISTPAADARTYFAEERTFLAWIRTGIALMGFGFVVARFGLFLRELASLRAFTELKASELSVPLGTVLIVVGVVVNIVAAVRHIRTINALNSGQPIATKPSFMAIVIAFLLAGAGLAIAIYLAKELVAK